MKDLLQMKAEKAIKEAVREVIEDHRRSGRPVVVWRKNRVARIPAGKLLNKNMVKPDKIKTGMPAGIVVK